MNRYKNLGELKIFHNVRPETLEQMQSLGKIVSMKKGTVCYRAAEKQDNIFILMDGQAIIYTLTRCGNRKIIFVHGGGELLNESIITTDKTTVFCDLIRDSKVFVIRNQVFCQLMERDFTLVKAVMYVQERKLWRTSHQLKNTLGSIYLEKKLAAKLWKLARDFGVPVVGEAGREEAAYSHDLQDSQEDTCVHVEKCSKRKTPCSGKKGQAVRIDVSLSITFLADFLGAPRETTSRICKSLVKRGLITIDKKTVTVTNMDCLAKFYKNHCGGKCSDTGGTYGSYK